REIMQRFFSLLSDGVRRFEGTVDKFTGDGIMALFGAPIAKEDHASRACFAALHIGELVSEYATELRRARGLNFSVRIGINSGEGGLSRFVGRAEEMAQLEEALERAKEGRGAVIGVVAEPGVGKSRLCQEFADRCRAEGIEVYETQAQAHGTAIPFLPVLQMM